MKEYTCLKDFYKDGIPFGRGLTYSVELNSADGRLYIYTVWGYTTISKELLNKNFF